MKWNRFTLKTKTEAEDIVICTLAEVGIEGVEIQDKQPLTDEDKAQMFVDIMPEGPADDGIAYLNFYLERGCGYRGNPERCEGCTGGSEKLCGYRRGNHHRIPDRGQGLDQ